MTELPAEYRILPASADFIVPGFEGLHRPGDRTLAPAPCDTTTWFHAFVDRLAAACGREFLPVCRMSDGEYLFVLGEQPPDLRLPSWRRTFMRLASGLRRLRRGGAFRAATIGHYHSGAYSASEWARARDVYAAIVPRLAERGILALHLTYGADGTRDRFQEHYFPALGRWLRQRGVTLTLENYVPFYFVYAALTGPRRSELLVGRRVLVVNGAEGPKRLAIEEGLRREGVAEVLWLPISAQRSLYDRIDVSAYRGRVDLGLVGAGVGKPNILLQLEPLGVPCIDAGFVFEVWADRDNGGRRPFCSPFSTNDGNTGPGSE